MKEITLKGYLGRDIVAYESGSENAKTVLVLVHGMQEHAKRYEWFKNKLNAAGIAFFAE